MVGLEGPPRSSPIPACQRGRTQGQWIVGRVHGVMMSCGGLTISAIWICSASSGRYLHMARYDTMQGALPLLVLKILSRRGPLHGYAITTQIDAMSDSVLRVEQGSLYPALHRMEEAGWVKARWVLTEYNRRA